MLWPQSYSTNKTRGHVWIQDCSYCYVFYRSKKQIKLKQTQISVDRLNYL